MKKLLVVFLLVFAISCGGSTGTPTDGGGTTGGTSTATTKSYQALSSLSLGLVNSVSPSISTYPKALADISLKTSTVGAWSCAESEGTYTCEITDSEGGSCSVTMTWAESDASLSFSCDNYSFEEDGEDVIIDGNFSETFTMVDNSTESALDVEFGFTVTTPNGLDITVGSDSISYGSDFELDMSMTITGTIDGQTFNINMTMTFTASGTVNGEDVSDSVTMTCTGTQTSYTCTES